MPVLSTRGSFWTAAAVVTLALWASGAPSMIYPVYAADWGLSTTVTTAIFAVYPTSLVVVMILFGAVSDHVGRRATLLVGVGAIALGILTFAVAPSVEWLFAGRVLQGVGVGLAMSPASAAMVEAGPPGHTARASSINTAATAVGLSMATIVAGALVEYAPWPRHLSFWVLLAVALVVWVAVFMMPMQASRGVQAPGRWRPRRPSVPNHLRVVWASSALAITAGFTMGSIVLALGAQIARDLVRTDNTLVAGAILALMAAFAGVAALAARRLEPRTAIAVGGLTAAVGMGLLVAAAVWSSLPVFLASSVLGGVGYGLLFLGGLGLVNRHAPVHHRAQTLSAVYLVAYLAQGVAAVVVGASATRFGLDVALDVSAPVIAVLCLAAGVVAVSAPRPQVQVTAPAAAGVGERG